MKVQFVNDVSPRSDKRSGKPTGITLFKEYTVIEIFDDEKKYSILNDDNKLCRYNQDRFIISCNDAVKPLNKAFNSLTSEMRQEIKRLRKYIETQNKENLEKNL